MLFAEQQIKKKPTDCCGEMLKNEKNSCHPSPAFREKSAQ